MILIEGEVRYVSTSRVTTAFSFSSSERTIVREISIEEDNNDPNVALNSAIQQLDQYRTGNIVSGLITAGGNQLSSVTGDVTINVNGHTTTVEINSASDFEIVADFIRQHANSNQENSQESTRNSFGSRSLN